MGLMSSSKFGWAITGRVGAKFEAGLFVSFHQGLDFGLRHELTVCAGLILISESPSLPAPGETILEPLPRFDLEQDIVTAVRG